MAVITLLGQAFNTTSGTHTVTATPAVGDLIVIIPVHSGTVGATAITDNNADGLGAYTFVTFATKNATTDTMGFFVRSSLVGSATSTIFSCAPGVTTGGGLAVLKITGMTVAGAAAIVQSAKQSDQAAGGTPAPVFGATPKSYNAIIGAIFNAANPATMTPRTGYSEKLDDGWNTPTTGIEIMAVNSGETSATLTWGGTSATAFGDVAAELVANSPPTTALNSPADAATGISTTPTLNFTGTDADSDTIEYNVQLKRKVVRDAYTGNQTATSSTVTYSHTVGAGSNTCLIVGISSRGGSISGVTYNGVAMTKESETLHGADSNTQQSASWWRLLAPAAGAHNVVITRTFNTNTQTVASQATSYFNVDQTTPIFGKQIQDKGNTGSPSSSITGVLGGVVLDLVGLPDNGSGATPSATAGQAQLYVSGTTGDTRGAFSEKPGADSSITMSWTVRSEIVLHGMIVINPVTLLNKLSASDTGFTAGHPFTSGVAKDYTVQAGDILGNSAVHYWRVAAIDPSGTNTYGAFTAWRSFTTQNPNYTKTHTTDVNKKKAQTKTHTTSTNKRKVTTKTHTTDTNKKKSGFTKTHTTDVNKKKAATKTHTTDIFKRIRVTKTHTTDTNKKKATTVSHTTDANKRKVTTRTHTTDINKKKSGLTQSHSTDTFKRVRPTKTHTTDVNKKKSGNTRTHTTDVVTHTSPTVSHTTSTNKKKATTVFHTTSVNKKKAQTVSHSTDTNKKKALTKVHTTDVNKKKSGNTRTHSTDTLKRKSFTKIHTTDVYTHLGVVTLTKDHTTDTFKKRRLTKVHTTDTFKKRSGTKVHTTDVNKKKAATRIHTTDVLKRTESELSHTTDIFTHRTLTRSHTTSVNKKKATSKTHTTDVNKRKGTIRIHTTDVLKRKKFTKSHSTDTTTHRSGTPHHSTDVNKKKATLVFHKTSVNKAKIVTYDTEFILVDGKPALQIFEDFYIKL